MYPWDVKHIHQEALEASKASKGDYSSYRWLHTINQHPTPALVSTLQERLHSSQCRLSGTGRCCQIICLSTQSSIFLQNYKHHVKLCESHYATLTFQQHPTTHILDNYISSYIVIWHSHRQWAKGRSGAQFREWSSRTDLSYCAKLFALFSALTQYKNKAVWNNSRHQRLIKILRSHCDFTQTSSWLFLHLLLWVFVGVQGDRLQIETKSVSASLSWKQRFNLEARKEGRERRWENWNTANRKLEGDRKAAEGKYSCDLVATCIQSNPCTYSDCKGRYREGSGDELRWNSIGRSHVLLLQTASEK